MRYKVLSNFDAGDGDFKKGDIYAGKFGPELLKQGLVEPLSEPTQEHAPKFDQPDYEMEAVVVAKPVKGKKGK